MPSDLTVPPHEQLTGSRVLHDSYLARVLPDGRYYFTLEFHRVDEEVILLPAGSADVRLQEPGLEFDVSLEERGGQVHVDVRLTNRNDVPIPLEWGGCSMNLLLYHDAARSNLAGEWPGGCLTYGRSATLGPGETMHPDAFVRDFDPAIVSDLPSGTYFLSVRLLVNWFDYHIPAGEIRLR